MGETVPMTTTDQPAPVTLDGFNPFSPAVQQCPHLYYRAMQEQAPVFNVPGTDLYTSAANLRLDPIWDHVRNDPRFQAEIPLFAAREKAFQ